ncbi:MAG: toprim domain-containing protein [Pirellulaceae bacterium]|nr:toprim domain-containing protein [Pirellulaceae bacterium]
MARGEWKRVSQRRPCPVCGRSDWCLYAGPDDAPTAAICARVERDRRAGEAGWFHRLRDDDRRAVRSVVVRGTQRPQATPVLDFGLFARECAERLQPQELQPLAGSLGLSVRSLQRLQVGWSATHRAFTFPMCDPARRVLGVRLRMASGHKLAVKGGREGLFVPIDLDIDDRLLVTEGPTDCAALLDLGFCAVGRPSCSGGVRLLIELVQAQRPAELVIVADGDAPGQRGAENLAAVLVAYSRAVRVITPPSGIKDSREWKRRGATAADVAAVIDVAPVRRLGIRTKVGRL